MLVDAPSPVEPGRDIRSPVLAGIRGLTRALPPREDPDRRYHRRSRLLRFFLPGRVSRIHLYEAQERYLNLRRMLDYHSEANSNGSDRHAAVSLCRRILDDASVLLTRRQQDLNFLWRDLTRVHIIMLEQILPSHLLPAHLDMCREEARRVAVRNDSEVTEMLQRLAEATQEDSDSPQQRERMIRSIRALLERFTTIRTGRIHQQFVNIRTYQVALMVLAPIALLLITNSEMIVGLPQATPSPAFPTLALATCTTRWLCPFEVVGNAAGDAISLAGYGFAHNILFFVFFVGLTGGFLSVVIRLRDRDLVPGEDAYFLWYVLSKPFVGALGAAILYVLIHANFVSLEIMSPVMDTVRQNIIGPVVFGFAFLSGFSERLLFPNFH